MAQAQRQNGTNANAGQAGDEAEGRVPTGLILEYVDSTMKVYKGRNLEELVLYVPAGLLGAAAALALLLVGRMTGYALAAVAIAVFSVARWADTSTEWYEVPRERVRNRIGYRALRRRLPFGHEEAMDVHGLRRFLASGGVQREDGICMALVSVDELIADRMPGPEIAQLIQSLRAGIDTELSDGWWAYYSTTRPSTTADLADHRLTRALDEDTDLSELQRDALFDSEEWLRTQDGYGEGEDWRVAEDDETEWQANDMRHYIVVTAHRYEGNENPLGATLLSALPDGVRSALSALPGVSDPAGESTGPDDGDSEDDAERSDLSDVHVIDEDAAEPLRAGDGRDVEETLTKRVAGVMDAVSEIGGVSARRATPAAHVDVATAYWGEDGRHVPSHEHGGQLMRAFEQEADATGYTPAERMVAPDEYDVVGNTVQVGSKFCRTYWVSTWPMKPKGLFLRSLSSETDVDIDVKLFCDPYPNAKDDLEHLVPEVDAEKEERIKQGDISSAAVEDKASAYMTAYLLLEHTNVTAWRLNGYITVRADSPQELNEDAETVRRILKSDPANCSVVASGTRQHWQFAAGAPFGVDEYAAVTARPKSRIALSGGIAAAFSAVAPRVEE